MPKRRETQITPAIEKQIYKWAEWLKTMHGVRFHPTTDIIFKAKVVTETRHCPCDADAKCPCPQVTDELTKFGTCFCRVFCTNEYVVDQSKFPHETVQDRHPIK